MGPHIYSHTTYASCIEFQKSKFAIRKRLQQILNMSTHYESLFTSSEESEESTRPVVPTPTPVKFEKRPSIINDKPATVTMKHTSKKAIIITSKLTGMIRKDINIAFEKICEKHGLMKLSVGRIITMDRNGTSFRGTFEGFGNVVSSDGNAPNLDKVIWDRDCQRYGFTPEQFGKYVF